MDKSPLDRAIEKAQTEQKASLLDRQKRLAEQKEIFDRVNLSFEELMTDVYHKLKALDIPPRLISVLEKTNWLGNRKQVPATYGWIVNETKDSYEGTGNILYISTDQKVGMAHRTYWGTKLADEKSAKYGKYTDIFSPPTRLEECDERINFLLSAVGEYYLIHYAPNVLTQNLCNTCWGVLPCRLQCRRLVL